MVGTPSRVPTIVHMAPMNDASWSPVGVDDTYRYSTAALSVFWPEAEHGELIARWPRLAAEGGSDLGRAPAAGRATLRAGSASRVPGQPRVRRCLRTRSVPAGQAQYRTLLAGFARLPGSANPTRHGRLATGTYRGMLVRLGAQVQAVLPPARPGHSGLTATLAAATRRSIPAWGHP